MKTYIADFGEGCNGGRYALIQAKSMRAAVLSADAVGWPERIAELKIPVDIEDAGPYLEIEEPAERYSGPSFSQLPWRDTDDAVDG